MSANKLAEANQPPTLENLVQAQKVCDFLGKMSLNELELMADLLQEPAAENLIAEPVPEVRAVKADVREAKPQRPTKTIESVAPKAIVAEAAPLTRDVLPVQEAPAEPAVAQVDPKPATEKQAPPPKEPVLPVMRAIEPAPAPIVISKEVKAEAVEPAAIVAEPPETIIPMQAETAQNVLPKMAETPILAAEPEDAPLQRSVEVVAPELTHLQVREAAVLEPTLAEAQTTLPPIDATEYLPEPLEDNPLVSWESAAPATTNEIEIITPLDITEPLLELNREFEVEPEPQNMVITAPEAERTGTPEVVQKPPAIEIVQAAVETPFEELTPVSVEIQEASAKLVVAIEAAFITASTETGEQLLPSDDLVILAEQKTEQTVPEELLVQCQEVLTQLKLPADTEAAYKVIINIRRQLALIEASQEKDEIIERPDEGTHEHKLDIAIWPQLIADDITYALQHALIGRYLLRAFALQG